MYIYDILLVTLQKELKHLDKLNLTGVVYVCQIT